MHMQALPTLETGGRKSPAICQGSALTLQGFWQTGSEASSATSQGLALKARRVRIQHEALRCFRAICPQLVDTVNQNNVTSSDIASIL